jgi:AraC family transcriptional activator of pobA
MEVDRLAPGAAVQVLLLDGMNVEQQRSPHRHDYHELIWVESGHGEHLIDGVEAPFQPGSVTIIGRGQVHVFSHATDLRGAVVRIADDLLLSGEARISTGWLLAASQARTIPVPASACGDLRSVLEPLQRELARAPDSLSADLQRSLVTTLLLWLERWYDSAHDPAGDCDADDVQLLRRFARQLETDYAAHHDAAHYAQALGVPAAALSRTLARLTGRTTKEQIVDRVMLEARRRLRFEDASVSEIAYAIGYSDPLYFSRAFKRHTGAAPQSYRAAVRGTAAVVAV